jgi:hypothetical protein
LNARTTKDRILSPTPLAKLGYPCVLDVMKNRVIKALTTVNGAGLVGPMGRPRTNNVNYRSHHTSELDLHDGELDEPFFNVIAQCPVTLRLVVYGASSTYG